MKSSKKIAARFAKAITLHCFRNGPIEGLHTGIFPDTKSGDYSDVKVVSPYGEIPWNQVARISQAEMKLIMQEAVNRAYTLLLAMQQGESEFISIVNDYAEHYTSHWDVPEKSKYIENIPGLWKLIKSAKE